MHLHVIFSTEEKPKRSRLKQKHIKFKATIHNVAYQGYPIFGNCACCSGSTVFAEIQGVIEACVRLTGMPHLTLSFMVSAQLWGYTVQWCLDFQMEMALEEQLFECDNFHAWIQWTVGKYNTEWYSMQIWLRNAQHCCNQAAVRWSIFFTENKECIAVSIIICLPAYVATVCVFIVFM